MAKYRQFHDVVELLIRHGRSEEEAAELLKDKKYVRSTEEIEREGKKREVLSGIHFRDVHLFLGRYNISPEAVRKYVYLYAIINNTTTPQCNTP